MKDIVFKARDYRGNTVDYRIEFDYARRSTNKVYVATVHPSGMHKWHVLQVNYKEGRGYYVNLTFPCGEKKRVFFTPEWV